MRPGRESAQGLQARTDDGYRAPPDGHGNPLPPSQLGYKGNIFSTMFGNNKDANVGSFTGEPPRHRLDRSAAGLSDAIAGSALWHRQGAAAPKASDYLVTTASCQR